MLRDKIISGLDPYRTQLELSDFRVRVGLDSTGDPAVWVTLILEDVVLDRIWNDRDQLRLKVEGIVRGIAGDQHWPYVTFQATSEQQAAVP